MAWQTDGTSTASRPYVAPDASDANAHVASFLEVFGLAHQADAALSSYSKGMRQKVLISAALLHDPSLLIFDGR